MFQLINLLRSTSKTIVITQNIRSFTSLYQNSGKVIFNTNSNFNTTIITRRLKTNKLLRDKVKDETKPQKVKLKSSDLRRLLALAKSEKWKIVGKTYFLFHK